jgi:pyridoxamine 5'-phosphate oxidase
MERKISELRREYTLAGLDERHVDPDPITQFLAWLEEAVKAELPEPTAMTLATVDGGGRPSARIVLLKGCDERGLVFFTNYDSRKGRELAQNPYAAAVFYWAALDRQVRVEGSVEKTAHEESETYFATRPVGARLSAWASPQSSPVADRAALEQAVAEMIDRFGERPVPLPPFWGGYRLRPERMEFWQGRRDRLHDRLLYERPSGAPDAGWRLTRLAP